MPAGPVEERVRRSFFTMIAVCAMGVGCAAPEGKPATPQAVPASSCSARTPAGCDAECRAGQGSSCVRLGAMLFTGRGVKRDAAAARTYLEAGCRAGAVDGCGLFAD